MESGSAKWTSEEIFDASARLGQEAAADIRRLNRARDVVLGWLQALTLLVAYMFDWLVLALVVEVPLFLAIMFWLRRKPYRKADLSMDLLVQAARTRRR